MRVSINKGHCFTLFKPRVIPSSINFNSYSTRALNRRSNLSIAIDKLLAIRLAGFNNGN